MGTVVRHREGATLGEDLLSVFFDGTEEWLYNDHELGTPPLVVQQPSTEPRREVSSFLLRLAAIIPAPVDSVKPEALFGLCWPVLERSITATRRLTSPRCSSGLIINSGPKMPYSDQLPWPITEWPRFKSRLAESTPAFRNIIVGSASVASSIGVVLFGINLLSGGPGAGDLTLGRIGLLLVFIGVSVVMFDIALAEKGKRTLLFWLSAASGIGLVVGAGGILYAFVGG
jgi:hypothetical protein